MAYNQENELNMDDKLNKVNLSLYVDVIEIWRTEEKCRLIKKSIEEIDNSIVLVNMENEGIEKQLINIKSRIEEIRDNIINTENINVSLNETLTYLKIQYNEKKNSIKKSRSDYELQLFIKMELWQKEEDRLNNIPEVKAIKIADSELKQLKLKYENLLVTQENLVEKIAKAEEENKKKLNHVIVNFTKAFVEMLSIDKKEEQCKTMLKNLKAEFHEKLKMKNELLESQKHKVGKVLFWKHTLCSFDSKNIDKKLDLLNKDLKSSISYSNNYNSDFSNQQQLSGELSKSRNEQKKSVTFLLPLQDEKAPSVTNDDDLNTNLVTSSQLNDITSCTNVLPVKKTPEINTGVEEMFMNVIEAKEKNVDDGAKPVNEGVLNSQTNKRKAIERESNFEFKKPYNSFQKVDHKKNYSNDQSNLIDKNFNTEDNFTKHNKNIESLNSFVNIMQDGHFGSDNDVQSKSFLKSNEQSNLKGSTSDNSKMFDNLLFQLNEGSYWNDSNKPTSQDSENSFCGSDLSELFKHSYDFNQCPDFKSNSVNSYNENSDPTCESDLRELQSQNSQQSSGSVKFQSFTNKSSKKMDTDSHTSKNAITKFIKSKNSNRPTTSNFVPLSPFRFNFK